MIRKLRLLLVISILTVAIAEGGTCTIQYGDDLVIDATVTSFYYDNGNPGYYSQGDQPHALITYFTTNQRRERYSYKFPIPEFLFQLPIDSAFLDLYTIGSVYSQPYQSSYALTLSPLLQDLTESIEQEGNTQWPTADVINIDTSDTYDNGYEGWIRLDITQLVSEWVNFEREPFGFVVKMFPESAPIQNRIAVAQSGNLPSIRPKILIQGSTVPDTLLTSNMTSLHFVENIIADYSLAVFPNPSNSGTTIRITALGGINYDVHILNIQGEIIKSWHQPGRNSGQSTIFWDGTDRVGKRTSSGIYFVTIQSPFGVKTQKIQIVK